MHTALPPVSLALASILVPGITGLLVLVAGGKRLPQLASQLASTITLALTGLLALSYEVPSSLTVITMRDLEVLSILVDPLSLIAGLLVASVGWAIMLFSYGYMSEANREHPVRKGYAWFYGLMLIFMASMLGVVYSSSLLGLALFYELTGICSFILIGFFHEGAKARYAALKALLITHLGGLAFYIAIALVYASTGSVRLDALGLLEGELKAWTLALLAVACWAKSAQLPFWMWLPDAMVAPTPVSAYLHAAAMVKVGAYVMMRAVQYTAPWGYELTALLGVMAVATMLYGFLMYFPQRDMKRLLAYSTITQLSYMFLALSFASTGSSLGLQAAVYHLWNHAYAKALFFLVAGALSYATGSRMLVDYSGLASRLKVPAVGFTVAALAIAGVPPLNCFYSKFYVFTSGFSTGSPLLAALTAVAVAESVGCFIWFLYWFTKCVLGDPSRLVEEATSPHWTMNASILLLVAACFTVQYLVAPILGEVVVLGGG